MTRHERLTRLALTLVATALVAACTAPSATAPSAQPAGTAKASQPAAAASGAPAATASQQPMEILGKFALEPTHGTWDTPVTATGTGLKASTKYDLVWTTGKVQWKLSEDRSKYLGRDAKTIQKTLQSVTTDGNGAFRATFDVPQSFGYGHDVMVVDEQKIIRNKSLFDVDMTTTITPTSGPVGAPYMNPNQQPVVASRPFPHIPFTVTDGPAVMPSKAETQGFAQIAAKPVAQGIWTAPYGATVGTPATLSAKALPANSEVEIFWTTMVGNRSVTGFEERTKSIGKTKTDTTGSFAWAWSIPDDLGGTHTVTAKLGETEVAKTTVYILANAFPLAVDRGPSGTRTTLHLKGVGWTETEQIYHVVVDNAFAGYACAFQSAGDLTIFLTVSGAPGWHYIDMYPGIYQGTETRPANYKMPQLTAATDHPGEKMPIFRWAFFITGQYPPSTED